MSTANKNSLISFLLCIPLVSFSASSIILKRSGVEILDISFYFLNSVGLLQALFHLGWCCLWASLLLLWWGLFSVVLHSLGTFITKAWEVLSRPFFCLDIEMIIWFLCIYLCGLFTYIDLHLLKHPCIFMKKANLAVGDNPVDAFFLDCFVKPFWIYVHQRSWPVIFFVCVYGGLLQ